MPAFVPLAEEGWIDHKATDLIAKEYLFPLTLEKIDTLVLGCTHYPLLAPAIAKIIPSTVTMIDSGKATASVVKQLLVDQKMQNDSTLKANLQFFVSDLPQKFTEIGERFLGTTLGRVQRVKYFLKPFVPNTAATDSCSLFTDNCAYFTSTMWTCLPLMSCPMGLSNKAGKYTYRWHNAMHSTAARNSLPAWFDCLTMSPLPCLISHRSSTIHGYQQAADKRWLLSD